MSLPKSVFVVGPDRLVTRMFEKRGYEPVDDPTTATVLCFTGGEDVSPSMYGEAALKETFSNPARDEEERAMLRYTRRHRIQGHQMAVGICRGGQFLNVMAGGRMWQHVNNHTKSHHAVDFLSGRKVWVTSTHHQMMVPLPSGTTHVLLLAGESTSKKSVLNDWVSDSPETLSPLDDVEAVWYENEKFLCFQPHPEYGNPECEQLFFEYIDRFWPPQSTNS